MYKYLLFCLCFTACHSVKPAFKINNIQHRLAIQTFQKELNLSFADSTSSPLSTEDRLQFVQLAFFDIDSNFRCMAKFTPKMGKVFKMKTTTDRQVEYRPYGQLVFELNGQKHRLMLYQNIKLSQKEKYKDYLFLPFTDATNGSDSYGGGRYIDFKIPQQKWVVLDFNKAYNPYCAYSSRYSCPIPQPQNDMNTKVIAGVKAPQDH